LFDIKNIAHAELAYASIAENIQYNVPDAHVL
jgi:hypothetical protein